MNKRASLNMAIEVIVVVVIAMTLLGLGLGFVRGQFSDITDTTVKVQKQIEQQILEELRTGNKKLSFPTDRYTLIGGDKEDLAIGVKNLLDRELRFKVEVQKKDSQGVFKPVTPETNKAGGFFWDDTPQDLGLGESRVYGILYEAENTKNTYLYKIVIQELDSSDKVIEAYDSKSFFVTVV